MSNETDEMRVALSRPLLKNEILDRMDEDGYLTEVVKVDLNDVVSSDIESFLDQLSELVIGSCLLMDIAYKAVAAKDNSIYIEVAGMVDESFLE